MQQRLASCAGATHSCAQAQTTLRRRPDRHHMLLACPSPKPPAWPPEEDLEPVVVEVVVPVFNEERVLVASIRHLRHHLNTEFPLGASVVIADNGSTDGTWRLAEDLSAELAGVRALRTDQTGSGSRLAHGLDREQRDRSGLHGRRPVDRSGRPVPPGGPAAVRPLRPGHRLPPGARRPGHAEPQARGDLPLLQPDPPDCAPHTFSDAQCGFKALRADVARTLVPMVEDEGWFFDTELLVLAERHGLRVHEVAVDWIEDADCRVKIAATAWADLKGIGAFAGTRAGPPSRAPPPGHATPPP